MHKLEALIVASRAVAFGSPTRLAAYQLGYGVDPDTRLPRLDGVTMTGQSGTPAATQNRPSSRSSTAPRPLR